MAGASDSPCIKAINRNVIHRICSGQVILDLSSAVKELLENSLDAGASCIEISLKNHGEESFKVTDNGCGISPSNFQVLALKYHTSKIADFADLQSLATFGFRGEALSSLCTLGNLTIETRTKNEQVGTLLKFDHSGLVISETKTARQVGTTVTVEKLFSSLPVRSKEFSRNIRREYGKLISLLNAYALIMKGVRLICTNVSGRSSKTVVLKTQGNSSLKDNVITVFGIDAFAGLEPLDLTLSEGCKVEGFLSKPGLGNGRNLGDRQFFYVNGRPVDMPKVSKLLNELYRCSNSKQYPVAIMNFLVPTRAYDVNVTPDKRKIFLSDEGSFVLSLREAIERIYSPSQCSYSINNIEKSKKRATNSDSERSCEGDVPHLSSKPLSPRRNEVTDTIQELIVDSVSSKVRTDCSTALGAIEETFSDRDEDSQEKDFASGVFEAADVRKFSVRQLETARESSILHDGADRQGVEFARSVMKGGVENMSSSCHTNFVQSSLRKFITVNKRKHENGCNVLSELPLLRNEIRPCQVRKTSLEVYTSASKSLNHLSDDRYKHSNKCLEHCPETSGNNSAELDTLNNVESDRDFSDKGKNSLCSIEGVKPLAGLDLTKLHEVSSSKIHVATSDTLKPCSSLVACSILHFNINDLRARRFRRIIRLQPVKFCNEEIKSARCYAAATLDCSQAEHGEGKEKSLAAATIELERFFRKYDFGCMKVVGQFNLGFIIGKLNNDLFIVDQHAADEKYNYEQLSQSTILNQQPLLQPMRLELSPEEEVIASMHMEIIRKNGFSLVEDVHAPPGRRFLLKAVPFSKNITFGVQDIKELISALADSQGECLVMSSYKMDSFDSICPSRIRAMLASRACHSSVMIGDSLSHTEMKKILQNLANLKSPWNCPHGRPTMRHLVDLTVVRDRYRKNLSLF